jgi:hypothetical protein
MNEAKVIATTDDIVSWVIVFEPKPELRGKIVKGVIKILKNVVQNIIQREFDKNLPGWIKKSGTFKIIPKP